MFLLGRLRCLLGWHHWIYFEGGHVHAGDDWEGARLPDGTPYMPGVTVCFYCGRTK